MSEEQERFSLLEVETGIARFKWKPFNIKFRFWASRKETCGQRFRLDLFDFEIFGEEVVLILWLFQIVGFHWIEDWFSFEIGFSKEKEFTFLNRESLDQVSNSKAPFVFVLDFLMAENQQPENTATVEEAEVPPAGTSKLIKVMLLGLKAQRSISQGGYIEMKQIAVKQLDLLRHVASGFTDQTDHLQQISDDIGANLNKLAQSFVKLSDVIKDGHTRSKDGGFPEPVLSSHPQWSEWNGERNEEPVLDSGRAENRWKRRKVRRGQLQGWQHASHLEPEFGRDPWKLSSELGC